MRREEMPEKGFLRDLAVPMCRARALVGAVAARVQDNPTALRVPTATES